MTGTVPRGPHGLSLTPASLHSVPAAWASSGLCLFLTIGTVLTSFELTPMKLRGVRVRVTSGFLSEIQGQVLSCHRRSPLLGWLGCQSSEPSWFSSWLWLLGFLCRFPLCVQAAGACLPSSSIDIDCSGPRPSPKRFRAPLRTDDCPAFIPSPGLRPMDTLVCMLNRHPELCMSQTELPPSPTAAGPTAPTAVLTQPMTTPPFHTSLPTLQTALQALPAV